MRIAYIINSVEGGGAASPVPAITGVLRGGGAAVKVFALTGRDRRGLAAMHAAGLEVAVRDGGETDHLAALGWLDRELRAWGPTHLWTSLTRATLLGQIVGRRRGWPVVSWQHAAYLKPANLILLRSMQRLSQLWIGDSESVTRLTAERLHVPGERLTMWPIFHVDVAVAPAAPWRLGAPVRIGSLGRLHPVKGYEVLIDALARMPAPAVPYQVCIAGEGGQREALAACAAAAGLANVEFVGFADDPRAFLAGCHLYVQPSRSEGLCIAAHEAMLSGLPVVASRVGELANTVTAEVGALVPPGDADALSRALAGLLAEPGQLAAIGAAARARVIDRFGPDTFRATGLAILERMRAM